MAITGVDYRPFAQQEIAVNSKSPLVDVLKTAPGVIGAGKEVYDKKEVDRFLDRRGAGLQEAAESLGIDGSMIRMVGDASYSDGLKMLIEAAEGVNRGAASKFVGDEMSTAEKDGFGVGAVDEKGRPLSTEELIKRRSTGQMGVLQRGMSTAKNPYVKKEYEDRLNKFKPLTEATGMTQNQVANIQAKYRDALRSEMDKSSKAMNINTQFIGSKNTEQANQRIDEIVGQMEKMGGWYDTLGKGEMFIFNSPSWLQSGMRYIQAAIQEGGSNSVGSAAKKLLQNALGPDIYNAISKGERKVTKADMERLGELGKKNNLYNNMLRSSLLMYVMDQLKQISGAAVTDTERSNFFNAYGMGLDDKAMIDNVAAVQRKASGVLRATAENAAERIGATMQPTNDFEKERFDAVMNYYSKIARSNDAMSDDLLGRLKALMDREDPSAGRVSTTKKKPGKNIVITAPLNVPKKKETLKKKSGVVRFDPNETAEIPE